MRNVISVFEVLFRRGPNRIKMVCTHRLNKIKTLIFHACQILLALSNSSSLPIFPFLKKKKKKVSEVQKDKFIKERDLARRIFLLAALLVSLTALRYHNI